jgi:stage II sporulation protein E
MLEDFARARRDGLKRGAENRLISAQFRQARQLIEALARQQGGTLRLRYRQASRAAVVLERAGIGVESVMALGGKGVEIVAALKEGCWTRTLARQASQRLSEAFGRRYAPTGPLGRELRFVRRPRLRVCTGISCASREAGAPCGDSHLACMLDDERLLVLVCDGMGSGEAARRESAVAARLLGRFLRAGATCDLAIETVNALLLNRSGEDMFATVDMLIINLNTGEAELVKLAACPTLILRGEALQRVEGGRLPLGILERVQPGGLRTRLLPGDVLLMASDGVADAAGEQALERLMRREGEDMPRLARLALASAERACQGGRRDDMTAVRLRVEER